MQRLHSYIRAPPWLQVRAGGISFAFALSVTRVPSEGVQGRSLCTHPPTPRLQGSDDRQSVRTDGLTPTVVYYLGSTAVVRVPFGEERLGSEGRGTVCRARDAPVAVSPFPNDGVRRSVR